jgi:hypothetical protein
VDRELLGAVVGVLSSLGAVHGILANGITDKPIELGSDNKPEDDDSNLDTGHARRIADSGQPGSDAFILEYPPVLSNRTANEHDDSDNGIDNTKSPRTAKRRRPCSSILPMLERRRFRITKMGKAEGKISITAIPASQETTMSGQLGGKFPLRRAAG